MILVQITGGKIFKNSKKLYYFNRFEQIYRKDEIIPAFIIILLLLILYIHYTLYTGIYGICYML